MQLYKETFNNEAAGVGIITDPRYFYCNANKRTYHKILTDPAVVQVFLDLLQIFHQNPTNKTKHDH
jgi:hypothetical protein